MADKKEKIIGEVMNYFDHVSVAAIKLVAPLKVGDIVRIVGGETDFEQKIESMQINRNSVKTAKKGDEIGIKISEKVRKGYKVFKL
ncbi:MAG TPA: translation elongation factor-like protein [Candidatus Nanoarchaeia archaeon]|nr:translation elongation factor-like protein [Candidatus Nanoarchaeia archaeon]